MRLPGEVDQPSVELQGFEGDLVVALVVGDARLVATHRDRDADIVVLDLLNAIRFSERDPLEQVLDDGSPPRPQSGPGRFDP
jgi:hypothetical protein